jgi:hypothetical protein
MYGQRSHAQLALQSAPLSRDKLLSLNKKTKLHDALSTPYIIHDHANPPCDAETALISKVLINLCAADGAVACR